MSEAAFVCYLCGLAVYESWRALETKIPCCKPCYEKAMRMPKGG